MGTDVLEANFLEREGALWMNGPSTHVFLSFVRNLDYIPTGKTSERDQMSKLNRLRATVQWTALRRLRLKTTKSYLKPQQLFIEVTNRCNSSCKMCGRANLNDLNKDMPMPLFKEIIRNLDGCDKINTTVMSTNIRTVPALPGLLASHDIGHLNLHPIIAYNDYGTERVLPGEGECFQDWSPPKTYKEFHEEMVGIGKDCGVKIGPFNEALYWPDCYAPWFDALVNLEGKVAPCCILMEKSMGDARNFEQVWNGQEMREWRRNLVEGAPPHRMCVQVCQKYT